MKDLLFERQKPFYLFATACRSSLFSVLVWFWCCRKLLRIPHLMIFECLQRFGELVVPDQVVRWDDDWLNCFGRVRLHQLLKVFGIRIGRILVCDCGIRYVGLIRHVLDVMLDVLVDVLQINGKFMKTRKLFFSNI